MSRSTTSVSIPKTVDVVEFDRPPGLPATCSDKELLEAVKASICGATDKDLAYLLHVPEFSVKYWVASKEWTAIKDHVIPELKGLLHTQLCGIRSTLIQKLGQRIREGEPQYNQLGEPVTDAEGNPVYRPVKARDLAIMLVQSSEVLHNLEVEIGLVVDESKNISLDDLAIALKNYAKAPADITGKSQRLS